jgi:hypothetical protein
VQTPYGPAIISGPPILPPGETYVICMKNIQAGLAGVTDPDLRRSGYDHAAAACAAAEAKTR